MTSARRAPRPPRAPVAAWTVYLVRCRDGSLYAGITNDLARRIAAHNAGTGARYTRARRPVELAWDEPAVTRGDALRREAALRRLGTAHKRELVAARAAPRARRARTRR